MRNPYQLISFVKNPSCNGEDCGVGEVGVVGEPFGVLTCDLGAKLFEVSRKLTGLSGRESDHLPPEERGKPSKTVKSARLSPVESNGHRAIWLLVRESSRHSR